MDRSHALRFASSTGLVLALFTAPAAGAALSEYLVPPQAADAAATEALEPHYVVIDRSVPKKGLLFLHLPGTSLTPAGSELIVKAAAASGLHAIGLRYPNEVSPTEYCPASGDPDCYDEAHEEAFSGADVSPFLATRRADSIEERIVRLLLHLDAQLPADGWKAFLDATGKPLWSRINLSGFSQGSGHAGWISKRHAVHRLALFGGPNDRQGDQSLPPWTQGPRATSAAASWGFCHVLDNGPGKVQAWEAFGWGTYGPPVLVESVDPPWNGSRMLLTNVPPAQESEYHKSVIQDLSTPKRPDGSPAFLPVWRLMGGFDEASETVSAWTIPSSARAPGAGGAFYTTRVVLGNPGVTAAWATLKFLGNGVDGTAGVEKTFHVGPGATLAFADVLGSVFGLESGFGAIRVTSNAAGLVVSAQTSTPGFGGTFGQAVPAVSSSELASTSVPRTIAGIQEDGSFRTNLFLASAAAAPVSVDVALVSAEGTPLATKRYDLPPLGMLQATRVVRDLGVTGDVPLARLVLTTATPGGAFAAYASVIDERTNDPRTLLAR